MVNPEEVKSIALMSHLTEEMQIKMAELAMVIKVKKGEYIFKEGDYAENLYAVLEGKVALEVEKSGGSPVRIKDIVVGRSFGISALVDTDEKRCISHARAVVDSRIICWRASDLERLFHTDNHLGFIVMKRVATVLKDRLQIKNAQLALYI